MLCCVTHNSHHDHSNEDLGETQCFSRLLNCAD